MILTHIIIHVSENSNASTKLIRRVIFFVENLYFVNFFSNFNKTQIVNQFEQVTNHSFHLKNVFVTAYEGGVWTSGGLFKMAFDQSVSMDALVLHKQPNFAEYRYDKVTVSVKVLFP